MGTLNAATLLCYLRGHHRRHEGFLRPLFGCRGLG